MTGKEILIFAQEVAYEPPRIAVALVIITIASIAFFLTRAWRRGASVPKTKAPILVPNPPTEIVSVQPSWTEKFLIPIIVSVISGLLTAGLLALFGTKN